MQWPQRAAAWQCHPAPLDEGSWGVNTTPLLFGPAAE